MVDILVKAIPLPVPRPEIDDIPVDPRIFWDKPISQLEDIFSYKDKVGLERMKEQLSYILEPLGQFYGWLDESIPSNKEDLFIFLTGIIILGLVISLTVNLVAWIFKK